MPGTFNGTTLTISATPVDGALIPDKSATNVAGIAIVGSDMYCVKTTGLIIFKHNLCFPAIPLHTT